MQRSWTELFQRGDLSEKDREQRTFLDYMVTAAAKSSCRADWLKVCVCECLWTHSGPPPRMRDGGEVGVVDVVLHGVHHG